jgi:hypothetical protein
VTDFLGGGLNLEAEGQTRYPTLQHYASVQLTSHFLFLFLWVGGFDRRSGREKSRADRERFGAPGSQFHVLPGTLYRLWKSSAVGGRVRVCKRP